MQIREQVFYLLGSLFVLIVIFCFLSYTAYSYSTGPLDSRTGAPGDAGNCTGSGCHSSYAVNSGTGTLNISGVPAAYEPSTNYTITVTLQQSNISKFGFEACVKKTIDNNQAGTISESSVDLQTSTSGGITYVKHTSSGTTGSVGSKSWSFIWTSPSFYSGSVKFYAAGNAANGDGFNSGDYIYTTLSSSSSSAQNRAPLVTNVTAQQRRGTKFVDITYNVSDADNDSLTITVQVSNDSGRTFSINPVTLSGAVGRGIRPGTDKSITWNAGTDYPNQFGSKFQIRVIAEDTKLVNDGYGDYLFVPAGEFQMGDNFYELFSSEQPLHTVNLNAYYIGKYEMTNGEYKKFIDDGGYTTQSYWIAGGFGQYGSQPSYWTNSSYRGGGITGNENFPVVGVNWYEASAYCKWLSAKTGKTYRLPTEAEWEKAARGTDGRRYPWGNTMDGSYANYSGSGDPYGNVTPVGYYDGTTHGSFATHNNASPYGAYDMAGNVCEWCYDWYSGTYYSNSPSSNPQGPSTGNDHVIRGGGWGNYFTEDLESALRGFINPFGNSGLGFRCLREP